MPAKLFLNIKKYITRFMTKIEHRRSTNEEGMKSWEAWGSRMETHLRTYRLEELSQVYRRDDSRLPAQWKKL